MKKSEKHIDQLKSLIESIEEVLTKSHRIVFNYYVDGTYGSDYIDWFKEMRANMRSASGMHEILNSKYESLLKRPNNTENYVVLLTEAKMMLQSIQSDIVKPIDKKLKWESSNKSSRKKIADDYSDKIKRLNNKSERLLQRANI